MLNQKKVYNEENTIQDIDTIQINDTKLTTVMKSFYLLSYLHNNEFDLTSRQPSVGLSRHSHL